MNIKKLSIFIISLLIIGIFIIYGLFRYNISLKKYFKNSNKILEYIDFLNKEEYKLNYLVLKTTFYLYENNDKVTKEINNIDKVLDMIKKDKFFKENFPLTFEKFLEFNNLFEKDKNNIYRFFTYNSLIKNATIYLVKVLNSSIDIFIDNKEFLKKEIYSIGNIFIIKNSFDKSFLDILNIDYFKKVSFKDEEKERLRMILVQNLLLFKKYFTKYSFYLNKVQNPISLKYLHTLYNTYNKEKLQNIKKLNYVFNFIIFILVGGVIIVSLLIYLINKEHSKLQKLFITDTLTNLGNREKFNQDVKKYKKPILYLVNIDKFKHINDIYGSEIGDKILKKVANILKENFECKNKNVYRVGADDFAILCEGELDYEEIIKYFKTHPIKIDDKIFNISVSIGISKETPLIETADMALKKVKKDTKSRSCIYTKESNLKEIYKENIQKSKILQDAIKHDLIVPVFQPIFYNKNLDICKYEVLARIKIDGNLVSIFPYLQIAKENKVYKEITKTIYLKTYEIFKNRDDEFSLNLSVDDIIDKETRDIIDKLFEDKNFAKRATFELLESEAIEDYEIVKNFIEKMKKIGVKFAIDDFGSGYSNFEHILNLKIDYLKIDGSLIRKIENKNTQIIVETINSFAKKMGIFTIAEFVSKKEIFEIVKKLNIDCSQGFYLSKPLEKI